MKIETILDEFERFTNQIEEITEKLTRDYDEFEKKFYEITSRAHDLSETRENTQRPQAINAHSTDDAAQIRLSRTELTTFKGAFEKWLSFYNHFISMVHENSGLSEIEKLYYLKNCLKEEAEEIITSLEMTGENYEVALQLLKDQRSGADRNRQIL